MRNLLLLGILLLTGCQSIPERRPVSDPLAVWKSRQQSLVNLEQWQLKGRLSVVNGVEAWFLDVRWQQNHSDYLIQLSGPFGAGQVQLHGNQDGVILTDSDQRAYYASEAEQLLYEHTGVHMPVEGLRYWILGLPGPDTVLNESERLDEFGRLAGLEQDGWLVRLNRYVQVNTHELPDKLVVNKDDIKVRVVVDNWLLGARNER